MKRGSGRCSAEQSRPRLESPLDARSRPAPVTPNEIRSPFAGSRRNGYGLYSGRSVLLGGRRRGAKFCADRTGGHARSCQCLGGPESEQRRR